MIFTARQLQVKCQEQNVDLYMTFVDLNKAFDTVSRDGLWKIMAKFGCPPRYIGHNQRLADQARKSMFAVLRKCRKLYLPVDIQLQLFDSIVVPVLLYASEVSGFESCDILERLCIQFYKIILRAKKTTPNTILYGELGRYPISIAVKSRMIGFWQKLINGKSDKISYKLYKILLALHEKDIFHSKWLLSIRNTLHESDKDLTWLSQVAPVNIAKIVKTKLIENYKEVWKVSVYESPKCLNYRIF